MKNLQFNKYYATKSDGVIWELISSNKSADLTRIRKRFTQTVIICSDSRCDVRAILPGDLFVIRNAGNIVETGQIPKSIKQVIVVGHEKESGVGCGACAAASAMEKDGKYPQKHGIPRELAIVAEKCLGDIRANANAVASSLREAGYETAALIFNHVTGRLEPLPGRKDCQSKMRLLLDKIKKHNGAYQSLHSKVTPRGDMGKAQNPYLIAVNLMDIPTMSDIIENTSIFNGPNCVFEVKPGGQEYTTFAQGSAQYAWLHALTQDPNFIDTDTTVFAVSDGARLKELEPILSQDQALRSFMHKDAAKVFGAVVNPTTYKLEQVYKLIVA